MRQTAVEWLVEDLGAYLPISITSVQLSINQAKEIEREQIIDAFDRGIQEQTQRVFINDPIITTPEQYYNKTFKE
jgi:hypothetical protein